MGKHELDPTAPTQVNHPWKAVLRTAAAWVGACLAFLGVALPLAQETLGPILPEGWQGYLVSALGIVTALGAFFTRLMAAAKAQQFLSKLGLGTGAEKEGAEVNGNE